MNHPTMNRAVIHVDASLLHHLFYIAVAQGISQVPADALQYQLLFEMPAAKGYRRHAWYLSNCKLVNLANSGSMRQNPTYPHLMHPPLDGEAEHHFSQSSLHLQHLRQ